VVKRIRIDSVNSSPQTLAGGLADPRAVAVDAENVYWTENPSDLIRMTPKGGSIAPPTTLTQSWGFNATLMADGHAVYIANWFGQRGVQRYDRCRNELSLLAPAANVTSMVLSNGYLYFNDESSPPTVRRFAY
jgi:hypothetical protein